MPINEKDLVEHKREIKNLLSSKKDSIGYQKRIEQLFGFDKRGFAILQEPTLRSCGGTTLAQIVAFLNPDEKLELEKIKKQTQVFGEKIGTPASRFLKVMNKYLLPLGYAARIKQQPEYDEIIRQIEKGTPVGCLMMATLKHHPVMKASRMPVEEDSYSAHYETVIGYSKKEDGHLDLIWLSDPFGHEEVITEKEFKSRRYMDDELMRTEKGLTLSGFAKELGLMSPATAFFIDKVNESHNIEKFSQEKKSMPIHESPDDKKSKEKNETLEREKLSFMLSNFSDTPPHTRSNDKITLGRVGHSTVLLNLFGTRIITDPVFSERFGMPIPTTPLVLGPERISKLPISIQDLPEIDIILLSHAHMDHLHPYSCNNIVKHSNNKTVIITAPGTSQFYPESLQGNICELDRGQDLSVTGINVRACRVNHRGGRYPWLPDRSKGDAKGLSYNAYMCEKNGRTLFFSGDTAYTNAMKDYAPKVCDLAIMPIGNYDPRIKNHCNPEQALEMAHMLHATNMVGIHWNSRSWSSNKDNPKGKKPLEWLLKSAKYYGIDVQWEHEGDVIVSQ